MNNTMNVLDSNYIAPKASTTVMITDYAGRSKIVQMKSVARYLKTNLQYTIAACHQAKYASFLAGK